MQTGMKYAKEKNYDMAIQFDADDRHLFRNIQKNGGSWYGETNCDVVIASRFYGGKMPLRMRTAGARLITAAIRLITKIYFHLDGGMRLYNRTIIEQFVKDANNSPEPDTLSYFEIRLAADVREVI